MTPNLELVRLSMLLHAHTHLDASLLVSGRSNVGIPSMIHIIAQLAASFLPPEGAQLNLLLSTPKTATLGFPLTSKGFARLGSLITVAGAAALDLPPVPQTFMRPGRASPALDAVLTSTPLFFHVSA